VNCLFEKVEAHEEMITASRRLIRIKNKMVINCDCILVAIAFVELISDALQTPLPKVEYFRWSLTWRGGGGAKRFGMKISS
jgi:hypothetical protein